MRAAILAALAAAALIPGAAQAVQMPVIDLDSPGIAGIPFPTVLEVRHRAELCRGYDDHSGHAFFDEAPWMRAVDGFGAMREQLALSERFFDESACVIPIGFYVHGGRLVRQPAR